MKKKIVIAGMDRHGIVIIQEHGVKIDSGLRVMGQRLGKAQLLMFVARSCWSEICSLVNKRVWRQKVSKVVLIVRVWWYCNPLAISGGMVNKAIHTQVHPSGYLNVYMRKLGARKLTKCLWDSSSPREEIGKENYAKLELRICKERLSVGHVRKKKESNDSR